MADGDDDLSFNPDSDDDSDDDLGFTPDSDDDLNFNPDDDNHPFDGGSDATEREVYLDVLRFLTYAMKRLTRLYDMITSPLYMPILISVTATHDFDNFVAEFVEVMKEFESINKSITCHRGERSYCDHVNETRTMLDIDEPVVESFWPKDATNEEKIIWWFTGDVKDINFPVLGIVKQKVWSPKGIATLTNMPQFCSDLFHVRNTIKDVLGDISVKLDEIKRARHCLTIERCRSQPTESDRGSKDDLCDECLTVQRRRSQSTESDSGSKDDLFLCGKDAPDDEIRREVTQDINNLSMAMYDIHDKMATLRWKGVCAADIMMTTANKSFNALSASVGMVQSKFFHIDVTAFDRTL